jgi:hypothetical protein
METYNHKALELIAGKQHGQREFEDLPKAKEFVD